MAIKVFKKYRIHILLWVAMIIYFVYAPDVYQVAFDKIGKPLQTNGIIPIESDQISFVVKDLTPSSQDGRGLFNLSGWAYMIPEEGETGDSYVREVILVSEEKTYFFSVRSQYSDPGPQSVADADVNLNTLGFSSLIAEYAIEPGKYRIGIVFKNISTGTAFYWDKPAHYVIKTSKTFKFR